MATTRAREAAATTRQRDVKARIRRSTAEAARERLLTGMPVTERRAERVAAGLGELVERTCPSPPALVGHGLGGAIAARFTVDQGHRVAQAVSTRHGWPLHVIEDAADDPAFEQPEAFLGGLHAALGPAASSSRRQP
jgi:pimeloyl-ACP methyl ester carboxylesterase